MPTSIPVLRPILVAAWLASVAPLSADLSEVRRLKLAGELEAARSLAEATLAAAETDRETAVYLHLELSRIADRVGLHRNSRPVAEALRQVELAAERAVGASPRARAEIELVRARWHYRAEMPEREFPLALEHAERAAARFREIDDRHGEAEAVHLLGLVRMQQRRLEEARELFDRSLELDREGETGGRTFFLGEYERHVGFVLYLGGDVAASVPYFERSLAARRAAGAVDASLFAARVLGAALVEAGRADEAFEPLLWALLVAERLDSPVGRARTGLALVELYEAVGEADSAREAARWTLEAADSVGLESVARQVRERLEAPPSAAR